MSRLSGSTDRFEIPQVPRFRLTRRRLIFAACLVMLVLAASSTHVRIGFQTAALLSEVYPDSPAYPARWLQDEPRRTLVQFPHDDQYQGAFLFEPGRRGCHGGIVLYIGLGPEHGDPHLHRFARAFARNGYSVLVPVSEPMVDYRLDAEDHLVAASAFQHLRDRPEIDADRVGMFGISVGGAIVVNAAQQPEIRDEVAMVHSLGGYYDAEVLLAHMGVRSFEVDGEWTEWEPSNVTFRATRNSVLDLLPEEDRAPLAEVFRLESSGVPSGLSDDSRALAELLANRDPARIDQLRENLPNHISAFLAEISPSHDLQHLVADTHLLHDRFDHVLPYSESVRFVSDAESLGMDSVHLTVLEQFHHVRPDEDSNRLSMLGDGFDLYRHIFRMHQSLDDRGWLTSPLTLFPGVSGPEQCD